MSDLDKLFIDLYAKKMKNLVPDGVKLMKLTTFLEEERKRKEHEDRLKKSTLGRELI
jgi:hypothetical protein